MNILRDVYKLFFLFFDMLHPGTTNFEGTSNLIVCKVSLSMVKV